MMTEEDEEVLFDQAGLLSNNIKTSPQIPKSRKACRLLRTFLLCTAFFGLGLCVAIPGPTLLDLQARTNTSTEQISRIFFGRSIGYLSGSILGGFMFDLINQNCVLTVTLLVTAVGTVAAPWSTNYLVLMGTFALQGIFMGFLDTGGNVVCLHIWGRSSGPAMQALHFSFGLGAFVAPLIAEPFLSRELNETIFINGLQDSKLHPNTLAINPHARSLELYMKHAAVDDNESAQLPNLAVTSLKIPHPTKPTTNGDPLSRDKGVVPNQAEANSMIGNALKQLYKRDAVDSDKSNEVASTNTSLVIPHPTKPITNADTLSKDKGVADGSKVGKKLAHMPKPADAALPTPSTTTVSACSNYTETNGTQICLDEPTTTASTTVSTTITTTTITTTTPTTTTTTTSTPSTTKSTPKTSPSPSPERGNDIPTTVATQNLTDSKLHYAIMNKVSEVLASFQSMTKVEFAYITIAAFLFLISLLHAFVCCCDGPCTLRATVISPGETDSEYLIHKESRGFRVQILILLFVFYFLYVGMEVTYGGLIMTFTVRHLGWDKAKGTLVTSVFWGAFAVGRGLAIFIARCLSPVVMLVSNLVITILSLGGLVMVLETNEQMLWFCTATLGIGMASIFPTGITWAERYMQVTGKAAAVFVVGSALGEMAMPVLTGYLFDKKGPMCLMYIMLVAAILSSIIYIIMQNLASNKGERYQRLNTLMKMAQSGDEEDEIESNVDNFSNHADQPDSDSQEDHGGGSLLQNGVNRKRVTFQLPEENGVRFKRGNRRHLKRTFLGRKSGKQM